MEFKPLSFVKSEIRLLKLHQSDDESAVVSCSLETISLVKPIPYTALSYCWGDPQATGRILINGVSVQVTTNLEAALRRLRAQKVECLWADAICINQSDAEEKSIQLVRMNMIYRKASSVIVWLGVEFHGIGKAIKIIENLSEPGYDARDDMEPWLGLRPLFELPYWRRV